MTASTTTGLVTWLREQIAETERVAREANVKQDDPEWRAHAVAAALPRVFRVRSARDARPIAMVTDLAGDSDTDTVGILDGAAAAAHIALHDPAAVLAQCEAHRRVVEFAQMVFENVGMIYDTTAAQLQYKTLRLVALAYCDRPGYRKEWKP